MADGRIVADGHKEDVLQAETLSLLFGKKVRLDQHEGYYRVW
jgi:ABC-type hemin transport system ATPase subunit